MPAALEAAETKKFATKFRNRKKCIVSSSYQDEIIKLGFNINWDTTGSGEF